MKKSQLLNSHVSHIVAQMGHTDGLCIADAGLPVPVGLEAPVRIDLAVSPGIPSFLDVLKAVLSEMEVEKVVMAREIQRMNPDILSSVVELLQQEKGREIDSGMIEFVSHEEFKAITHTNRAVLRTGECSPYANIILYSGVTF